MDGFEIMSRVADLITVASPIVTAAKAVLHARVLKTSPGEGEANRIASIPMGEDAMRLFEEGKLSCYEYCKARNFESIVLKAAMSCSNEEDDHRDPEYDWEWLNRFYEEAGNITDEKVQEIWAKILAGEINGQTKYSYKTLETLKDMGQEDAILFGRVMSCSIKIGNRLFLPEDENYLSQNNLSYGDIMSLNEMGLIHEVSANLNLDLNTRTQPLFHNMEFMVLITVKGDPEQIGHIPIRNYAFTNVGKELEGLYNVDLSDENLMLFASLLNDSLQSAGLSELRASVHKTIPSESVEEHPTIFTKDLLTGEEVAFEAERQ